MKDFFVQTRKKVLRVIDNLTSFEKNKSNCSLQDAINIASCKSDLIIAKKMLDILVDLYSSDNTDTASFKDDYYKWKLEWNTEKNTCSYNNIKPQNVFLHSFKNQLN